MIEILLGAVTTEVVGDFFLKIVHPNLVRAGHRNEHLAALDVNIPRRADDLLASAAPAVVIASLRAVADECGHGFGFRIDHPQGVVFGIGDVKVVPVQGEPL